MVLVKVDCWWGDMMWPQQPQGREKDNGDE